MRRTDLLRYGAALLVAWFAGPGLVWAAELVTTPNSATAWKLEVASTAAATMRQEQDALRFDISRCDGQNWHVQVYQDGKRVRPGVVYTLRFTARASTPRKLGILCQTSASPWRQVLPGFPSVDLTTAWQAYTVLLDLQNTNNELLRVPMFVLGEATGTVWLKDVSVTDPAGAAPPSPAPQTTVVPAPSGSTAGLLSDPLEPSSWRFDTRDGARGTLGSEAGMLRIQVDASGAGGAGAEARQVQIYQTPPALAAGRTYFLTISVRSTTPRKLIFTAQPDASPNDPLLPATPLNVGPEWKQYKLRFTLKQPLSGPARLPVLQMGDTAGTVFIRSMTLMEATE